MTVTVNREELLRKLQAVQPGLSTREIVEQSGCFVFRRGFVMAFNDELFCRAPSGLGKELEGAVQAAPLLKVLEKMPEEMIEIGDYRSFNISTEASGGELIIKGKRRSAGVRMQAEILLPVASVEKPESWQELPADFGEALKMVVPCAASETADFKYTCVHLTPKWIEACQPPGTMVATSDGRVPIESIRTGQRVWSYSYQSGKGQRSIIGANRDCENQFRYGHQVTRVGRRDYTGDLVVLTAGEKTTRYTADHECLVRLDGVFRDKYVVYLLRRGDQFRVGVTGPRRWKGKWMNPRRDGRADVRVRLNAQRANCCWVLACFDTQEEALAEERFVAVRYGIPDMLFRIRPGESVGRQEQCDLFWGRFGNNLEGGESCLKAYGRILDYPFAERKATEDQTRYPGSHPSHMGDVEIKIRACNLMVGMKVLDADKCTNGKVTDACWSSFTLRREAYSGLVYSMTVDRAHTYIADGIVTHNCDNFQLCRWRLPTGVKAPTLVRNGSLKHVSSLGLTEFAETDGWLHFRGAGGIQLSCRRFVEEYNDLGPYFKNRGTPTALPKGLAAEAESAAIFSSDDAEHDHVKVEIGKGRLRIRGEGVNGWYDSGAKKVNYAGDPIAFLVSPKVLIALVQQHNECEVSEDYLRVNGGKFTYLSCLSRPQTNGEPPTEGSEE